MFKPKKVLVLAPHTDDGEFGCGGSVARFLEAGADVFSAAFSSCRQSVPGHLPEDILISEYKAANSALGVKKKNIFLFDYDVRNFPQSRQAILEDLIRLKKDVSPDLIFMPSVNDIHQDHRVIAEEGLRAFKFATILCYEIPWNNLQFNSTAFVPLEERHLNVKLKALSKYRSQEHRDYSDASYIRSLARVRGVQIGRSFAEMFDVIRWVLK